MSDVLVSDQLVTLPERPLERKRPTRSIRPRLIGPVLVFDAVRSARRGHFIVLRCAYTGFLLALLFAIFAGRMLGANLSVRQVLTGANMPTGEVAGFVELFALTFLVIQLIAAYLLTPPYTAGAITEEKERKTIAFLLASDLSSVEIVVAKALVRLAILSLILLAGLPFLSILQFLGGIDPPMLAAGFGLTVIGMLSLTALGIAMSVSAHRTRQAIARTYGWSALYLVLSGASWLLLLPAAGWSGFPSTATWVSPITVNDLVDWFSLGNPIAVAVKLYVGVQSGASLDSLIPSALGSYAAFHGVLTILLIGWSAWRLRAAALAEGKRAKTVPDINPERKRWLWRKRPAVSDRPMLWKELWAEPGVRPGKWARIVLGSVAPVSFLPLVFILYFEFAADTWDDVGSAANLWIRIATALVACLMLAGVGLRAAGGLSGERERHTLDPLLSSPMRIRLILRAKWLASILVSRWSWIWLGLIWLCGLLTKGLAWQAIPDMVATWLFMAAFLASLGLWISTWAGTTQRALQWMLLAIAIVGAGHWLVWLVCTPLATQLEIADRTLDDVMEIEAVGLTPPLTFMLLAIPPADYSDSPWATWTNTASIVRQGWLFWLVGAVVFWILATASFRRAIDRSADAGDWDPIARWLGPRRDSRWPRVRRLAPAGFALSAFMVLFVFYGLTAHGSYARLDAAIAEADRLDPGWRQDELETKRKRVPDDENAAFQVQAIGPEYARTRWYPGKQWPSIDDLQDKVKNIPPNQLLDHDLSLAVERELNAVQQVRLQGRLLRSFSAGRSPLRYKPDGYYTLLPWVARARHTADVLWFDSVALAQAGDLNGSLESCIATLNCECMVGDEPIFVSQLVRCACVRVALSAAQRLLAQGAAPKTALERLQASLEKLMNERFLLIGARGDRAMHDTAYCYMDQHISDRFPTSHSYLANEIRKLPWNDRLLIALGVHLTAERAALIHLTNRYVEISKLPPEQWREEFLALRTAASCLSGFSKSVSQNMRTTNRMPVITQILLAQLRCMVVLVAIERFRQENDRWPVQFSELVPKYLAATPTDPFDGLPVRFKKIADGVLVYTVGPDLQDNGGTFPARPKKLGDPGTDIGFQLWNVSQRRLPPAPAKPAKAMHP